MKNKKQTLCEFAAILLTTATNLVDNQADKVALVKMKHEFIECGLDKDYVLPEVHGLVNRTLKNLKESCTCHLKNIEDGSTDEGAE